MGTSDDKGKPGVTDDLDAGWDEEKEPNVDDLDGSWGDDEPEAPERPEPPEPEEEPEPEPPGLTPEERAARAEALAARAAARKERARAAALEKKARRKAKADAVVAKKKTKKKRGSRPPRSTVTPEESPRDESIARPHGERAPVTTGTRRPKQRSSLVTILVMVVVALGVTAGVVLWLRR